MREVEVDGRAQVTANHHPGAVADLPVLRREDVRPGRLEAGHLGPLATVDLDVEALRQSLDDRHPLAP